MISEKQPHHHILETELTWFREIVSKRLADPTGKNNFEAIASSDIADLQGDTHYEEVIRRLKLDGPGRVLLLLALARALDDQSLFGLKDLWSSQFNLESEEKSTNQNTQWWARHLVGGHLHQETQTFIPTLKTLLFLLNGNNQIARQEALLHFQAHHPLFTEGIIEMHPLGAGSQGGGVIQDWINHQIFLHPAYLRYFLGGPFPEPNIDLRLPIRALDFRLSLKDLALSEQIETQLKPARHFVKAGQAFFEEANFEKAKVHDKFNKGFKICLQGVPDEDKALIASALGKTLGIKAYQLEVTQIMSSYTSESAGNIEKVFAKLQRTLRWLEGQMCILFIDEGDVILERPDQVEGHKEQVADRLLSWILKHLDKFPGLLILATDQEAGLNKNLGQYIQTLLTVALPNEAQRGLLWKNILPRHFYYASPDLPDILAQSFVLTRGQIQNVLKQACLHASNDETNTLEFSRHLEPYIKSEYLKKDQTYQTPAEVQDKPVSPESQKRAQEEGNRKEDDRKENNKKESKKTPSRIEETKQKTQLDERDTKVFEEPAKSPQTTSPPMNPQNLQPPRPSAPSPGNGIYNADNQYTPPPAPSQYEMDGNRVILNSELAINGWLRFLPQGFAYGRQELPKNLGEFYALTEHEIKVTLQMAANLAEQEGSQQIQFSPHISEPLEILKEKLKKASLYRDKFSNM